MKKNGGIENLLVIIGKCEAIKNQNKSKQNKFE
jgi:hypothetical protein